MVAQLVKKFHCRNWWHKLHSSC